MARTLESLEPGTPVFAGTTRVGTVNGVYAEGDARAAEIVVLRRDGGEELAIPAGQVERIDADGVHLLRREPGVDDLAPFDAERFSTLKKLA